jgi:hypothetical protein
MDQGKEVAVLLIKRVFNVIAQSKCQEATKLHGKSAQIQTSPSSDSRGPRRGERSAPQLINDWGRCKRGTG